ncbi:phospholipase C [Sinobacterium caligoides]|uniref:Phospholipase C n=1 Tax=Sinobacterium caligoides TaxID=933926 RepID=A0A3N2DZ20_9GAMM|nr:phospholipase C, phosphocholine-specific [Sinobacterium caligoides]ROS05111.1 phospholipase C [Sinobacterium caligoides]
MVDQSKRSFVINSSIGLTAAATSPNLLASIEKAVAIPGRHHHGSIKDVEHIVILMQENRAFDHYFGTLPGVRNFGDRFAIKLPNGDHVWKQPSGDDAVPPWYWNTNEKVGYHRMSSTNHSFQSAQKSWNYGIMDQWVPNRTALTMGYYRKEDLEFQFSLAENFTFCDAYHCSFAGCTIPNRVFLWSGSINPSGDLMGPVHGNSHEGWGEIEDIDKGYAWTTYPERLEEAGISWRVYHEAGNCYDDNPLLGFKTFRYLHINDREHPVYQRGTAGQGSDYLSALLDDVQGNTLPQVSWLVASADYSEHPSRSCPLQGAAYTSQVLDILTSNPDVWSKTVFLVMFDENDGLFDHMPPPAVPSRITPNDGGDVKTYGKSNISTAGEYIVKPDLNETNEQMIGRPYPLGPRVPMYVISPWSVGRKVNSQVFDHTSVIRFIEERFGVKEPNISEWRREVCGDLTSCFDFSKQGSTPYIKPEKKTHADKVRKRADIYNEQHMPRFDEASDVGLPAVLPQQVPSSPLPYQLEVQADKKCRHGESSIHLSFINSGRQAAVFQLYDGKAKDNGEPLFPYRYTVKNNGDKDRELSDKWLFDDDYHLMVYGPNGFIRFFKGNHNPSIKEPAIKYRYLNSGRICKFSISAFNPNKHQTLNIVITPNEYTNKQYTMTLKPHEEIEYHLPLEKHCWYDFTVKAIEVTGFERRVAGRIDRAKPHKYPCWSDPAMGRLSNDKELDAMNE